jgi:hypothetical protein
MKSLYLRSGLALLCGVILSACGGSDGSLQLSGSISGLAKDGLKLVNNGNGETVTVTSGATSFYFEKLIAVDDYFDVQVATQPTNALCSVSNNQGKANVYNAYYVVVTCASTPRTLGGTVNNLTADGLVLANGPETVTIAKPASGTSATFTFPAKVGDGQSYGVNVLSQPTGQQCTIKSGTGVGLIGENNANSVVVDCTP